jgi:hypothetical protein
MGAIYVYLSFNSKHFSINIFAILLQIAETLCGLAFQGKKKFKKFQKKNFEQVQNSSFATLLHLFFVKLFSKLLRNLANALVI